ncbi:MAG: acyltransferase family protein [Clostridiaceae bacterium]
MGLQSKQSIDIRNHDYWNIVKGIGILSIVLGHTCWFAKEYVYLYHLALFFFIAGYFYSEQKYGDDPFSYITSRLRSLWLRYVFFVFAFILLHNVFLKTGIIINVAEYGLRDIVINTLNSFLLSCSETMGGALWFVPVLIFAGALFAGTVWVGHVISKKLDRGNFVKYLIIVLTGCIIGVIGIILNQKQMFLGYHVHTSFLVVPLFTGAYFIRIGCKDLSSLLKWYIAIPIALGLWCCVKFLGWHIALSDEEIIGPLRFFIISYSGIYMCLYFAKLIQMIPLVRHYFQLIGTYSFEIMACHFLTTKIIDLIYAAIIGETDRLVYGAFVSAYSKECWFFYALFGTLVPALVALGVKRLWQSILHK